MTQADAIALLLSGERRRRARSAGVKAFFKALVGLALDLAVMAALRGWALMALVDVLNDAWLKSIPNLGFRAAFEIALLLGVLIPGVLNYNAKNN